MTLTFTIQAKAAEKILKAAVARGVKAESLCEAVNFDPSVLEDPDSRMPFAQLVALYEKAAELTGDENFGLHIGESVALSAFDVVGYCALNSSTLGAAFARVARYHSIWTDGALFTLETADDTSAIVYRYSDPSILEHRQDSEMTLATVTTLCRNIATPDFTPAAVEFQHAAPANLTEHERLFNCPVKFGATTNRLSFPSAFLSLPIAKADASLCALLDRHAEELLTKYPPRDSLIDRVRTVIADEFRGGEPSVERIADQLGLTARTLQRKLQELGTSYNDVLDQMRRQLAMRYLREPQMAICEVAYLLGFSESSSFHRAFKRWTGVTPKEFRSN
ncbi:MAG TPA: AraC family transcriptional regulator [Pyrinomonadaceae bacterium]|nr:AraC family transcriptional regulator [Pyrinomonadaceae bacterium]